MTFEQLEDNCALYGTEQMIKIPCLPWEANICRNNTAKYRRSDWQNAVVDHIFNVYILYSHIIHDQAQKLTIKDDFSSLLLSYHSKI